MLISSISPTIQANQLYNRQLQDIAILMYKVKNNMCPTYSSTLFKQPAINYKLRNHDFTIPRFNSVSFGKLSLRYIGPKVWSSVPSNVKKASTLSSFKYNIRNVDLSMLLDDNNCSNCSICISYFFIYFFYQIMDTFVHIAYSSPEFLICLNCT